MRRTLKRTLVGAITAAALVVGSSLAFAHADSGIPAGSHNFLVTLYGWPDNSPPGGDIEYPQIHQSAGGTGTYNDPITVATDSNELAPGTIVYYPYLKRYFIMEDGCAECSTDWANGKSHIDLWVGGQNGDPTAVLNCEDALTQDNASAIVNPDPAEPVDTRPLFDSTTNTCYTPS